MSRSNQENFDDSTFEELDARLQKEELRIANAVRNKEWSLAAELEGSLGALREAVEAKRPASSVSLDEMIKKAEQDLDSALRKKQFDKCNVLQEQLDSLMAQRKKLPDPDKAGADEKEDSNDGNKHGFESRAALETEIYSLSIQIDSAVAGKDFQKAASLQEQVEHLETMRQFLPTLVELEASVRENTEAVQRAVSMKKFSEAERLQSTLDGLQKKLDMERSQQGAVVVSSGSAINSTLPKTDNLKVDTPPKLHANSPTKSEVDRPPESVVLRKKTTSNVDKGRAVYKLRPKKPVVVEPHESVLSVAKTITRSRGDAALILLSEEGYAGVLTPHHVTEKVVAQDIDAASISVSSVMKTKLGVALDDSAGDALSNMLDNRHRYLPVHDKNDTLVGILDIGQCLNDAIKKLKVAKDSSSKAAQDVVEQMAPGANVKGLMAMLGPALKQAFGESVSPSVRSLLAGKPSTIVDPNSCVRDVAKVMARDDKAALIVEGDTLVGMVTVKDIMEKAVAREVSMDNTTIKSIMEPNPAPVSPDTTAIEALQVMQADRVLSLPVCEDDGTTLGSVDVMDLIYGCGGAEGWRAIFDTSIEAEDMTDAESFISGVSASRLTTRSQPSVSQVRELRPVHKLRPKRPVVADPSQSVLSVAQTISKARGDAALIKLDNKPGFAGVVTPHHVTEKVLAKRLDPATVSISSIMKTKRAVKMNDSAGDALSNMLDNKHRYLPVMDDHGTLVGILDIGQCLSDAITKLEQAQETNNKTAENVLAQVAMANSGAGEHVNKLQALLGPVLQAAFGESASPVLSSLLEGKSPNIVTPETSIETAATIIAEHDKAALVIQEGELVGMVTVKDIMDMAVAKGLDPKKTPVETLMTTHPETVPPDMTALEALQVMHQDRVSSLPVCDDSGKVFGSVDVLDLIYGCGGANGWKSIFDSSMETTDVTSQYGSSNTRANASTRPTSTPATPRKIRAHAAEVVLVKTPTVRTPEIRSPPTVPTVVEMIPEITFKLVYPNNTMRRFRCKPTLESVTAVAGDVQLTYVDADGDCIDITSDECLDDAVKHAKSIGSQTVKLGVRQASTIKSLWNSVSKISNPITVENLPRLW